MNIEGLKTQQNNNEVEVDFIRHGDTNYLENIQENIGELQEILLDLTELGIEQISKVGVEIANRIDPQKEVVILWSSPAWRAQGAESIIKNILNERGIEIFKKSIINSLSPITKYPDKSKVEVDKKMRENAGSVFNWIRYIAEKVSKENKKIHIVGVAHHEFLNIIREDLFPLDVPGGKGFQKGENINIKFLFNKQNNTLSITASMRDMIVDNIIFDKDNRKFVNKT